MSLAILAIMAVSLAGAIAIGLKVTAANGPRAQLAGNNDVMAFEQQIGADIARADCLTAPGNAAPNAALPQISGVGQCKQSVSKTSGSGSTCGTGYFLCLAWYTVTGTPTCHTVIYAQKATSSVLLRSDKVGATTTTSRFTVGGIGTATVTWPVAKLVTNLPTGNPPTSYTWTKDVDVTISQGTAPGHAKTPVAATFHISPLIADPLSSTLTVPGTPALPC